MLACHWILPFISMHASLACTRTLQRFGATHVRTRRDSAPNGEIWAEPICRTGYAATPCFAAKSGQQELPRSPETGRGNPQVSRRPLASRLVVRQGRRAVPCPATPSAHSHLASSSARGGGPSLAQRPRRRSSSSGRRPFLELELRYPPSASRSSISELRYPPQAACSSSSGLRRRPANPHRRIPTEPWGRNPLPVSLPNLIFSWID